MFLDCFAQSRNYWYDESIVDTWLFSRLVVLRRKMPCGLDLGLLHPEVVVIALEPWLPLFRQSCLKEGRRKNVESIRSFRNLFNVREGNECLSLLRRSWSTFPLSRGWTVDVVLRFESRWSLVGCSRWMVAGRLIPVGTWPVECVGPRNSSTGSSLSITCRLFPPEHRWPFSWSCRCCLCLVVSMTSSSLVDVVSACLELCETSKLFTDVHTPILKECSPLCSLS